MGVVSWVVVGGAVWVEVGVVGGLVYVGLQLLVSCLQAWLV